MKLLVICGPTASGKTALAVKCAQILGGEVISADSMIVYRGLNIGTAKPTKTEMGGVPHHMIDVASPFGDFSVSDYEKMALPIIENLMQAGKVPILCGGTGFYLKALLFQSSFGGAPGCENVRKNLQYIAQKMGKGALHEILKCVDDESAKVLHENDEKRVIRAIEIFILTGKKKSSQRDGVTFRYPFEAFSFAFPREELYARIDRRVEEMMGAGLVEEVEGLLKSGVPEDAQCMQGIGYKEIVECLKFGDLHSTMSDIIKKNTRNYAKRQLTFFKKLPNLHFIEPKEIEDAAREVIQIYGQDR